tara:strand:- start:2088 stop:2273 length:186 start_codon:yes stop_codon:yes gene_type:complete
MLGAWEIILIILVIIILFGSKKIPELAKGIVLGLKEFKNAANDIKEEVHNNVEDNKEDKKM